MEDLIAALAEIFGEFLLEMLFELPTMAVSGIIEHERSRPVLVILGLTLFGAVAGLLSAWAIPHQLIGTRAVLPGVSLVLAPLAAGLAMHLLGKRLRNAGQFASDLATFHGGALFAFSMALVRWGLVGLPH